MDRRTFIATGVVIAITGFPRPSLAAPAAPETLSVAAAINKAGRQRMLSQRQAKAWLLLGHGVLPDKAEAILQQSMALFEKQLDELAQLLPNDKLRAAHRALGEQWKPYRVLLKSSASPEMARQIYAANEKVLAAAHKLTVEYEQLSGTQTGQLINISGRQRMLSQRVAKFFLFQQWGINAAQSKAEMDKARGEFSAAMVKLGAAPQNTARIKSELDLAAQQWLFFENAVSLSNPADALRAATDVATTSERILEQMDLVVKLYEGLGA